MRIVYNLPHVFSLETSLVENADVLRTLLECLVQINLDYLRRYRAPKLYNSGVVYGRTKQWEPIPALYARGYGDCKSLSAALIAQYEMQGRAASPVFRFSPSSYAGADHLLFHILVQTEKGYEDPSRKLGMGKDEWKYFSGKNAQPITLETDGKEVSSP
jgi:hypothetical protein